MAANNRPARPPKVATLLGWAAATGQEARQVAQRHRRRQLLLTVAERDACRDELAEQYALGRLDEAELDRRVDLLHQATTHGDLEPVFDGLPLPDLNRPKPRRPGRWRWIVFGVAAWMALPIILLGVVYLIAGRSGAGLAFTLPSLFWVLLWWRWAAVRSPHGRRPPRWRRNG